MTETSSVSNPFVKLGLPANPVILAPLAGVSDHPFRRACSRHEADLTYVEMLSATALVYESRRTYEMMVRHPSETRLGVQVTGKAADEVGRAVEILNRYSFETIDLNMGCPVAKVVRNGAGSGILKDPQRVYDTVKAACAATDKPLSVKIRLGWDKKTVTFFEVADAAASAGAAWLTIHGRLRCDDYAVPVDLPKIAELKRRLAIPVIGNGNIFSQADAEHMRRFTGVDGVMVSRGALGNPWVFRDIKSGEKPVFLDDWLSTVLDHLAWQRETYGEGGVGAVCMRKHLLWYLKGWPNARKLREKLSQMTSIDEAAGLLEGFANELQKDGVRERLPITHDNFDSRFLWDPKYEMDRALDRGVGDDGEGEPACEVSI